MMGHSHKTGSGENISEHAGETKMELKESQESNISEKGLMNDTKKEAAEQHEAELKIPREHARLDPLLTQIPKKAQHGLLMQCDLILTCIDANEHYITLGTNIGLTFLYNRKNHNVQRLKSETTSDVITCIKLHHGVDHQLAVGMASGTLCIFLIPSFISLHKKQLQKFDVRAVHRHYITCVEWSTNGMKLFSGDKTGHVVVTEVDFYELVPNVDKVLGQDLFFLCVCTRVQQHSGTKQLTHSPHTTSLGQCKSSLLLVEPPTEIVQLNYDHKVLVVSTKQRSFVCRVDTTSELVQVGQQERKVPGSFGACFIPGLCKVEDALIYAARPSCRVWLSNMAGSVLNTHIFKDSISAGVHEIPILQPSRTSFNPNAELQFGRLLLYRDKQLITYNTTTLFVLDPRQNCVVASQNKLGGIVDVAVHRDEIFVLRRHNDDSVIRIADEPEVFYSNALPFDMPLSSASATGISNTTTVMSTAPVPPETLTESKEENKTKSFLKKTFFTPFKKLDNFIHEQRTHQGREPFDPPPAILKPETGLNSEGTIDKETPSSSQRESDSASPDLPPVVALNSPDLDLRLFNTESKDIKSPDSAHSALSVFADETVSPTSEVASGVRIDVTAPDNENTAAAGQERLLSVGDCISLSTGSAGESVDIVFSHQMHRKKGKKKKHKEELKVNKEADNISQSSFDSQKLEDIISEGNHHPPQGQAEEEGVDDILLRAEEALFSVDRLLSGGGGDKSESSKTNEIAETDTNRIAGHDEDEGCSAGHISSSQVSEEESGKGMNVISTDATNMRQTSADDSDVKQTASKGSDIKQTSADASNIKQTAAAADSVKGEKAENIPLASSSDVDTCDSKAHPAASSNDSAVHFSFDSSVNSDHDPSVKSDQLLEGSITSSNTPREGEDAMEAAERTLDNMTKYSKMKVTKEDAADDFYSKFSSPYSPTDSLESYSLLTQEQRPFSDGEGDLDRQVSVSSGGNPETTLQRLANSWSAFTTPANIYSLGLSCSHIWFTDKGENLYFSVIGGAKGLVWRKVSSSPANQISVSPSGHIVWRLHRKRVFAGTKITQRHPEGLKWVEAVQDVVNISVDDHCAWYIKSSGAVMMQRSLSKERPCYTSITVVTPWPLRQMMARHGVVWAVTDSMKLLVRIGITTEVPQGIGWKEIKRHKEPFLFSSVSIDNEGIGWAVDVLGQIWFTDSVTLQNPEGSGHWWQVPLSEYYVQDPSVLDMIRSIAKKFDPQKLSHILSTNRGGLIVAGCQGVWLSLDYLNTLYVCRSSLQGYHWSSAQPSQMAEATVWKLVQTSIADLDWGTVWAQSANGELFSILPDSSDTMQVDSPDFISFSVNEHAFWGLTGSGEIHLRTGMGAHCPQGADWIMLDLTQLGESSLVHMSCNSSYVWVVDSDGRVFHRIGAAPPKLNQLNPVWLPIDSYSEIIFTKVVCGPLDWMVWAVDNRRLTYVRMGISEGLPIGKEWMHVPGIQAMDISLSSSGVWALNTNGEILFRYGITEDNLSGNYWKKIPGCFTKLSASHKDVLWAVDTHGHLVKCSSRHIWRHQDSTELSQRRVSSTGSEEGDWELV